MALRLNFYNKIINHINQFQIENEYVDSTSQLIYYNEIQKEIILLFKKFNFSQHIKFKIESLVQKNGTVEEINKNRRIKIQQYANANKGSYDTVDIYVKFKEEDEQITFELLDNNILFDIATMEI